MRTKSLLMAGRLLPSAMRSSNLWSLILAICNDGNVNSPRPASGHEYKKAMPWLHRETQFACEGLGDLVTLERAKLRSEIRGPDQAWNGLLTSFEK
jgi:hypothetical protein